MSAVHSSMLELGVPCPDFSLPNVNGAAVSRGDFSGRPLLVVFMCNHCPFVIHIREELAALGREAQQKKFGMVGISANNVETHPEDSPEKMKAEALRAGYVFPYLYDKSQQTALAFKATCTPDFFLFDTAHKLAYRGRLDDSRPGNDIPVTGRDLRSAIDAVLTGHSPASEQKPSMGCNIKWKSSSSD